MVRISGQSTEFAVQEKQNVREREQCGANKTTDVPQKLSGSNTSNPNVKLNTPPKLDYTCFGKKVKVQIDGKLISRPAATAAAEVSRQAFNAVGDAARDVNNDMPEYPYIIDYETFPKPEDYTQFGKNAFYQWKQDVETWRDDRLEEIRMHKSNNLSGMEERLNEQFGGLKEQQFKNFVALYSRFLITENTIRMVAVELKGDVIAIRNRLEQMRIQITAEIQKGIRQVNENTDQRAVELHEHMFNAVVGVHEHIYEQTEEINANTDKDAEAVIEQNKNNAKAIAEQNAENTKIQIQEMQRLTDEIKTILTNQPSKEEVARETLKQLGIAVAISLPVLSILGSLSLPVLRNLRNAL